MKSVLRLSLFLVLAPLGLFAAPKAAFTSGIISKDTPSAVIEADVTGAATLVLVVDDGGDGYSCDWADWVEPVLVGPQGEVKVTSLKPVEAATGHGTVNVDKNASGGAMKVGGQPVNGFGVHANSIITFDITGKGFTKFKAKGGLDNGGTDQGCGSTVRFLVYALKAGETIPKNAASPNKQGGLTPEETMVGLTVPDGLEVSLFASEPMISNPTDIDVDAKGRVWVCEGVNYRRWANNDPKGDRIVILEDTDGDGKADKHTVFYQGPEINAALGICVLGNKVIVSCSPNVFCFYDDDNDGKADRKETIFTGISGAQHDHAMHAFQFGPDGKLYFNFGNAGGQLKTADGKPVVDLAGNEVNDKGKPYRQGMVFRCDENFSNVETLGWNFRNNYEVTVDSFGTLWQSDNDDDGNKGVRINYVMEFGNFGYTDEKTGAGWSTYRIGWEDEIPRRHWYQNDPGVVPNLLVTGAGSPTGITTYEGDLLPKNFQNQIIHCDAGPRATRAYPVTKDGAGYAATTENVLTAKDNWYRPSDVCVMPDGSLMIADWYDPGVGGHNMQDNTPGQTKGRLYRVAPAGHKLSVPKIDLSSASGAVAALRSPNYATRYLAWKKLQELGAASASPLTKLAKDDNPRMRARGIWAIARAAAQTDDAIKMALGDKDEDVRGMAIRIAREAGSNVEGIVKQLVRDPSAQVRRECAIALRFSKSPDAPALWAELAAQYDGKDRWYLEALGIGSDLNAAACLDAWLKKVGGKWNSPEGRDIVWRTRGAQAAKLLADIVLDPALPDAQRPRFVRALHFLDSNADRDAALLRLLGSQFAADVAPMLSFKSAQGRESEIGKALDSVKGTAQFVRLVDYFKLAGHDAALLDLALSGKDVTASTAAARHLVANGKLNLLTDALRGNTAAAAALALGLSNDKRVLPALEAVATDANSAARVPAASAMASIESGAKRIFELVRENKLADDAKATALNSISGSLWNDLSAEAKKMLGATAPNKLPGIKELAQKSGDATKGRVLFQAICTSCHQVNDVGGNYGPALSEIGTKLGKDAIYEALLNPNNGISFGYETIYLNFKSGDSAIGLLASETKDEITLKSVGGALTSYPKRDLTGKPEKLKTSSMPEVARGLPADSLADLVEYLSSLKKK